MNLIKVRSENFLHLIRAHHNGVSVENGKNRTLSPWQRPQRSELACADFGVVRPNRLNLSIWGIPVDADAILTQVPTVN
jgi:hypothetical protein